MRRLGTIASWINENLPELEAVTERDHCNTDRKLAGIRLIHKGKGRYGTRITVRRWANREVVLVHSSAETYRTNDEVERWLQGYIDGLELHQSGRLTKKGSA